jgi:hypothetical protein
MIEHFTQMALEFMKEIWFQLDSRFDLKNTDTFEFVKPYLIQLQESPTYLWTFLATLFLVPYSFIKIRNLLRKRERKLDELIEEMEGEEIYDEDDPRRLRRPNLADEKERKASKPDVKNSSSTYKKVFDETEEKEVLNVDQDELELNSTKIFEKEETIEIEEVIEPINLPPIENDFNNDPNEFMSLEKNIDSPINDANHDEAIKELQEEDEVAKLDEINSESDPFENFFDIDEPIIEPQEEHELKELEGNKSGNDPLGDFLALNEIEQDKIIKDLQDEKDKEVEEEPNSLKDLDKVHINEKSSEVISLFEGLSGSESELSYTKSDTTDDQENSSPTGSQNSLSPESEKKDSIDIDKKAKLKTEYTEEPLIIPKTRDYEPELSGLKFEAESDISSKERKILAEDLISEEKSINLGKTPEPELGPERSIHTNDFNTLEGSDSLIDRLKFLQSRFENRFQSTENPTENLSTPIEKSIPVKDYVRFTEPRSDSTSALPPDSNKYMDLLESFVFIKDQKHR